MKYLIFSDCHGSSYYMEKIIEAYQFHKCDKMICLGDLLYHGPRNDLPYGHNPKEVIKLVNQYKDSIIMIKGNCEAEVDQMVLEFPIVEMGIVDINNRTIVLTHGHKINYQLPIALPNDSICFYGHTHVSKIDKVNGTYYVNPGSISLPKENTKNSYVVFDGSQIEWFDDEHNSIKVENI